MSVTLTLMPAASVAVIAGRPSRVAGILIMTFGRATAACPPLRAIEHRAQLVARHADVVDRQRLEQRLALEPARDAVGDRGVVVAGPGSAGCPRDRLLEDGGVRGHAHDAGLAHVAIELAREQVAAADEIEPDALAQFEELLRAAGHRVTLGQGWRGATGNQHE